jgi:hypothetical protein
MTGNPPLGFIMFLFSIPAAIGSTIPPAGGELLVGSASGRGVSRQTGAARTIGVEGAVGVVEACEMPTSVESGSTLH